MTQNDSTKQQNTLELLKNNQSHNHMEPTEEGIKTCRVCGSSKPVSEYHFRYDTKKYRKECKTCHHDKQLLRNYGITLGEYNSLLEKQNGVCAICSLPQKSKRNTRFCVDHDHTTGEVRGLLCDSCNRGIGLLKDDSRLLDKAAKYLRSFEE